MKLTQIYLLTGDKDIEPSRSEPISTTTPIPTTVTSMIWLKTIDWKNIINIIMYYNSSSCSLFASLIQSLKHNQKYIDKASKFSN